MPTESRNHTFKIRLPHNFTCFKNVDILVLQRQKTKLNSRFFLF